MDQELAVAVRPAAAGKQWIGSAWGLFAGQVGTWLVLVIILFAVTVLAAFVPLGSLAMNVVSPVFIGGMMIGAHQQARGGRAEIGHLLAGFSQRFVDLLLLGLIQILATLVVGLVGAIGAMLTIGLSVFENPEALGGISVVTWLLLALVMTVPLAAMIMAFWIATPLVAVAGCKPWEAVERSFDAAWRNWRALLVYGLLALLLGLIAVIPFGLGLIVLMPVLMLAGYTACADLFSLNSTPPSQPSTLEVNKVPTPDEDEADDRFGAS